MFRIMKTTLKRSALTDFCNALFLYFNVRIFAFQESRCFLDIPFQFLYLIF